MSEWSMIGIFPFLASYRVTNLMQLARVKRIDTFKIFKNAAWLKYLNSLFIWFGVKIVNTGCVLRNGHCKHSLIWNRYSSSHPLMLLVYIIVLYGKLMSANL